MNIYAAFHDRVAGVLDVLARDGRLPQGLDPARFVAEPPRDPAHGDIALNAAMVFAREAKASFGAPRALAEAIAARLRDEPDVAAVEIAGPGFINVRLAAGVFERVLQTALDAGPDFARGAAARGAHMRPVNIEYVSANPTGPMHVGHTRGAVFGDALANLLTFGGASVAREYYINDAGAQVDILARSVFLRYREALGKAITIPEGLYPGDYLKPVGAALAARHGDALLAQSEAQWLPPVREAAIAAMLALIREDLAALDIRHEVFFSEASLVSSRAVEAAIDALRARGLVYQGRLPPPKGAPSEDWEDREQTLFRSTQFGDDVDRPLLKSDGGYTYFAADIAYHKSKIDRGFQSMIDIMGADHGGYVKRMKAAVSALSDGAAEVDIRLCQMVRLMRAGEPVKMSKRSGDLVTLREVVDEVGPDAVRFMMLFRKNDATLDFDLAAVREQSKDNPVFYVQYAHARGQSVLRQAAKVYPDADLTARAELALLTDEGELALMRLIAQYPRVIEAAAHAHEPHRVAFYVHDLASAFHSHWNRGKDQPQLRFVNETRRDLSLARAALVRALTGVIASGLAVLGVSAPLEMR